MASKKIIKTDSAPLINQNNIEKYVYMIRGVKVLLDSDLANAYGYETRAFNRQVSNNNERFPDGFMFRLTAEEYKEILVCKKYTSSWGGNRKLPRVFTEYGVLMLGNVLKGPVAVAQSIEMVIAFKTLKDKYLGEGNFLLSTNNNVRQRVEENSKDIRELKNKTIQIEEKADYIENTLSAIVSSFSDQGLFNHRIILNGQKIESDIAYQEIYRSARKSVWLIDDYIGLKTLELLKACGKNVEIKVFSDNVNRMPTVFVEDFISDTGIELELLPTNNKYHDRFVLIDYGAENEQIFVCGSSSKDGGNKISTIVKIQDNKEYHSLFGDLING